MPRGRFLIHPPREFVCFCKGLRPLSRGHPERTPFGGISASIGYRLRDPSRQSRVGMTVPPPDRTKLRGAVIRRTWCTAVGGSDKLTRRVYQDDGARRGGPFRTNSRGVCMRMTERGE